MDAHRPDVDAHLRAGIAIYDAGRFHAAHDAWEAAWLAAKDDPDRRDDARLLQGLIQLAAAIHHGRRGNWEGVEGLAESAGEYLVALPPDYREVNVDEAREYLDALAADPGRAEHVDPPALTHRGEPLGYADLDFEAVAVVARVVAEENDAYDTAVVERGVEAARESVDAGGADEFVALVFDFVTDDDHRDIVYTRLRDHAERRERERRDVDGLFEE